MKKIVLLFLIIVICSSCGNNKKENGKVQTQTFKKVITEGNIEVKCYEEGNAQLYKYCVYNEEKKKIYEKDGLSSEPMTKHISSTISKVIVSAGTGVALVRYFDIKRSLVSEVFITPWDEYETKLIRFDSNNNVIVQDMFNRDECFDFALPLIKCADVNNAIISARFIASNEVEIQYYNEKGQEESKKIVLDNK